MENKLCTLCCENKPLSEFSIRKGKYRKRCILCCTITNKTCIACGINKPVSEFFKSKDTYKPRCKDCSYKQNSEYTRNEDASTKEKRKEYMREYMAAASAKKRSEKLRSDNTDELKNIADQTNENFKLLEDTQGNFTSNENPMEVE